jgi:hypothetical protein
MPQFFCSSREDPMAEGNRKKIYLIVIVILLALLAFKMI